MQKNRHQRHMLDDIGEIARVESMSIIHEISLDPRGGRFIFQILAGAAEKSHG
jgi:hypothetical protein